MTEMQKSNAGEKSVKCIYREQELNAEIQLVSYLSATQTFVSMRKQVQTKNTTATT